jgi:hypothetical protein
LVRDLHAHACFPAALSAVGRFSQHTLCRGTLVAGALALGRLFHAHTFLLRGADAYAAAALANVLVFLRFGRCAL